MTLFKYIFKANEKTTCPALMMVYRNFGKTIKKKFKFAFLPQIRMMEVTISSSIMVIKAGVGDIGKNSKSKLDFESFGPKNPIPSLHASL